MEKGSKIEAFLPDFLCVYLPDVSSEIFSVLLWSVFLTGLAGGFAHCAFMCGPFVMMQMSHRLASVPASEMSELTRLKGAALLPYHLGRITTYALLGCVVGFLGGMVSNAWHDSTAILMLVGGVGMSLSAFHVKTLKLTQVIMPRSVVNLLGNITRPFTQSDAFLQRYALGLFLGFLPCGMIYGALSVAAATESFWKGAVIMAVLGFSTIPGLLTVALAGNLFLNTQKIRFSFVLKSITFFVGIWLCLVATHLLLK